MRRYRSLSMPKNAQRALRVGPARPACDPAHRTSAGRVPSDRQGSVHSTTPGVNEHPLSTPACRERLRPRCFVRGISWRPAIDSGSGRGASGAWIVARKPKSTFWALEKRSPNVLPPHLDFCENRVGASLAA